MSRIPIGSSPSASCRPTRNLPFTGFHVPIAVPGRDEPPSVGRQLPFLVAAAPELFTILGIRVIEGRVLTAADDRGAPVVVVNQSMARGVWPGESAVGKCIRIGFPPNFQSDSGPPVPDETVPCREVVGVVNDTRQRSLVPVNDEDRLMQYYVPFSQVPFPPFMPDPGLNGAAKWRFASRSAPAHRRCSAWCCAKRSASPRSVRCWPRCCRRDRRRGPIPACCCARTDRGQGAACRIRLCVPS